MLKDYLQRDIYNLIIKSFSFRDITEIRMRVNQKIIIVVKNRKFYLKNDIGEYVISTSEMIENFLRRASDNSMYAFNESIINGYLTINGGIRIGVAGYVVHENGNVSTIKEFQSINIRIPHIIKNCSVPAYDFLADNDIKNTLIISPPGAGKTTFLRDFVYQLGEHNIAKNILIVDERNEICSVSDSEPNINLGGFCDIYTNCTKNFAFTNGIRSMRPDIIVTDEIDLNRDLEAIVEAMNSGVKVVATIHATDIKQLKRKKGFDYILDNQLFERFVVLSDAEGPGTLAFIYNEKLDCIYSR